MSTIINATIWLRYLMKKVRLKTNIVKPNASSMLAERPNLINGGIQYFNLDKNKEALKFFRYLCRISFLSDVG